MDASREICYLMGRRGQFGVENKTWCEKYGTALLRLSDLRGTMDVDNGERMRFGAKVNVGHV